jgi:hypothetical protein
MTFVQPSNSTSPPTANASPHTALFDDVLLGGFECSEHRLRDGRRLDLLSSTRHDVLADADYARLREVGIGACREGLSWVRSEPSSGRYDFSTAARLIQAARQHDVQIIWDLMHFGWPDDVDIFAPSFPTRFARYASAFARWYQGESDRRLIVAPINEMSFLAWAGGDVRYLNPFEAARGTELKVQLVLATIAAIEAIRDVIPNARFLSPEPIIRVVPNPEHPKTWARIDSDNLLQFQSWDMLSGRVWPTLGGHARYLDILGLNFYPDNQFMLDGTVVRLGDEAYRPFSSLAEDVWSRYHRPMIVSETGCEGELRPTWFRYMVEECCRALRAGCALHGLTLYPIVNHPGWGDDRHCENGLWDYADAAGQREIFRPLADELQRAAERLRKERAATFARASASESHRPTPSVVAHAESL